MCRLLGVKVSTYYSVVNRQPSKRQINRNRSVLLVKAGHKETRMSYGHKRLQAHLVAQGHDISAYMVRSIKQAEKIYCKRHKRFKSTTHSDHNKPVFCNMLEQNFAVTAANKAWCSDITYLWTAEGWLYLAGVKDLYTKEIVGYAMDKRMTADLVNQALQRAIALKSPPRELIVHSDQGGQYCSESYRKLINKHKLTGSMSRRGNCYDNAPIESFWGILKNELYHHNDYETRLEAKREVSKYIECFYNKQRIQEGLGMRTPWQVANDYNLLAA